MPAGATDRAEPSFVLPDASAAPDWRQAARSWVGAAENEAPDAESLVDPEFDLDRVVAAEASDEEPPPDELVPFTERVSQARIAGDHEALVAILAEQLETLSSPDEDSDAAKLHLELGLLLYYEIDDPNAARVHLEKACELGDDALASSPETLAALEGVYEDLEDFAKLYTVLEKRLDIADTDELKRVLQLLMAQLCIDRLDRHDEALELVSAVLDECPEHEAGLRLAADIYRSRNELDGAIKVLRTLLDVLPTDDPFFAETLVALADVHADAGSYEVANETYGKALATTEAPLDVLRSMQDVCRAAENWEGLLRAVVASFALSLGEDYETYGIGQLLKLEVSEVPSHLMAHAQHVCREAGDILSTKLNRPMPAWVLYGKAHELGGDDPYALERRIELGRSLERWSHLVRDLERLTGTLLDPELRFEALNEAGDIARERLNDPLRARGLYEQAAQIYAHRRDDAPPVLALIEQRLDRLRENVVVQFSLGKSSAKITPPPPEPDDPASDDLPAVALSDDPSKQVSNGTSPEPDADDEIAPDDSLEEELAAIDAALGDEPTRQRRVTLLTEKGLLLVGRPARGKEGLVALRAALALDSQHVPARLALAEYLIDEADTEQALNHLVVLVQRARASTLENRYQRTLRTLLNNLASGSDEACANRATTLIRSLPPVILP